MIRGGRVLLSPRVPYATFGAGKGNTMARELLIKNDLLLGSERAKEKVGDVYKNIYVPNGAIIVKSAFSQYIYTISKNSDTFRKGSLVVAVSQPNDDTGPAMLCFAEAVYIQRIDEQSFAIQLAELHVDGDVKEVTRGITSFYVTCAAFIEVPDETPSESKE